MLLAIQKPKLSDNAPTAVVLFAGGGGIEAGMIQSGIRPVVAVEFDREKPQLSRAIAQTHGRNFNEYNCKVVQKSVQQVAELGFKDFPKNADFLHASPVCSNFSQAHTAKAGKSKETNNDLEAADAVAKAICRLQPRIFTFENVARYQSSNSFNLVLTTLESQGYLVTCSVVNMADFGVPQARKRLVLVAGKGFRIPLPDTNKQIGWYESIEHLIPLMPDSKLLPKQEEALKNFLTNNYPTPLLIERIGGRSGKFRYKPAHLPCNTILRSHFTDQKGSNRTKFADIWLPDGTVKSLTIAAAARLQGFPEWYQFPEEASVAGSIIGYSVPPSFAKQLFVGILEAIGGQNG